MKKIGFLSFGHWADHPSYKTRTAADTLLQSIDLAVAAEEIGIECGFGALYYFSRVFKEIEGVSPTGYREQW